MLKTSWVASANSAETDFPLNNLPYGVFSVGDADLRCGVAIGDRIIDATGLEAAGILRADPDADVLDAPYWNDFMALGPKVWAAYRAKLQDLLAEGASEEVQDQLTTYSVPMSEATLHLPFKVAEYTDFYAGKHHATNVGTMFRGAENALPPNWLSIPIGYNGRASSVVVSGTDVRRPWGQLKGPDMDLPVFAPCKRFDIELEMGAIVGMPSDGPVTVQEADDMIFGYVLLNDWSARDIQAWEYQPLGPFQAKATATSLSPWIVTKAALEPFRCSTPHRERVLLPYLEEPGPMLYDIPLSVSILPENAEKPEVLARTNYREMYYSAAQQLAHHTTAGSPMNVGDLLGSGTISGPSKDERGSLLEMSWGGKEPLTLADGSTRSFIEDGDTLTLSGAAQGDGYRVGFGDCAGTVIPALDDPYKRG
ncbi:fumarylacetoacetase [Psychromarinibacter halotolerans]|uniref:fumarylacetoacetase n=1 Tax=Psychromarinibacter halotolerans TaxID=1775175 RepID=A0ABV7GLU5_9RHOB|nr:fumarylacetoacetase [Psychromarinibacter halotolerans]MDF0595915.1 fumarylacetoacetase [Psychromarinibacter halotolerans]